jgi:hypothetical protein
VIVVVSVSTTKAAALLSAITRSLFDIDWGEKNL